MSCTVCGAFTRFTIADDNLRESCICASCGATNRHRQIAYVLSDRLSDITGSHVTSATTIPSACPSLAIYNTESRGPLHDHLSKVAGYECSEYFGPAHRSGERVGAILHQDLMQLSFPDASFDLVLSSDVFEHIPEPYRAHQEVARVLKRGGRHIFTVPFHPSGYVDDVRARVDSSGTPKLLAPAIYHHDPVSGKCDVLVYTIFGLEMLVRLSSLGFQTTLYHLTAPWLGILGPNAIVFDAVKA
jgi:SAM-dependent methyltransferase